MSTTAADLAALAHYREQLAIRAQAIQSAAAMWKTWHLTIADSWKAMEKIALPLVDHHYAQSAASGAAFYEKSAALAGHAHSAKPAPGLDPEQVSSALANAGLVGVYVGKKRGLSDAAAMSSGFVRFQAAFARLAMTGTRDVVTLSSAQTGGWRRQVAGTCDWCELLAEKIAKYQFQAHDNCQCLAVPTFTPATHETPMPTVQQVKETIGQAKTDLSTITQDKSFAPSFASESEIKPGIDFMEQHLPNEKSINDIETRPAVKSEIVQNVAARMADDPEFADWYRATGRPEQKALEASRTVGGAISDEAAFQTALEEDVNNMVHRWAMSSGDNDYKAIALQEKAKEMFKLEQTYDEGWTQYTLQSAREELAENGPMYEAFIRGTYEETQTRLAQEGIDELVLYRGMDLEVDELVARPYGTHIEKDIRLQPLSSFSSKKNVSSSFGPTLMQVRVPREMIFSTARSGVGCLHEYEYVLVGGPGRATVWENIDFQGDF